ncbi:MAG: hypothetical protein O2854_04300 [Chloroflexi bacterium]|nr:hypothetical protein [Chloroflexota bacterium]
MSGSTSTASAGRRAGSSYGVGGLPLWNRQPSNAPPKLPEAEASPARTPEGLSLYPGRTAFNLWQSHKLTPPVDLKALADALDLKVVTFPFEGRFSEVIAQGIVALPPNLDRKWFRWRVAHALGHYMMHVGAGFYTETEQWPVHTSAERQAEEFAAWLLAGPRGQALPHEQAKLPAKKWAFVTEFLGQFASAA